MQPTKFLSLLFLSSFPLLLTSCGSDALQSSSNQEIPSSTPEDSTARSSLDIVPFQEKLQFLEKSGNSCSDGELAELFKTQAALLQLYSKEMHETHDLSSATGTAKKLAPFFRRVVSLSATCLQNPKLPEKQRARLKSLAHFRLQDRAIAQFLSSSARFCSAPELENIVLALKWRTLSNSSRAGLKKALLNCGISNEEKLRSAENRIPFVKMHSALLKASTNRCSLEVRKQAEKSAAVLMHEFPSVSRPTRSSKILAAQLRVDLFDLTQSILKSCVPREVSEGQQAKLTLPAWGDAPARKPWTDAVLQVVRARMSDFNKASDTDTFCPGYANAELHEKENCWLLIVSAVAKRESSFKTETSFEEANGVDSIGLLALSSGECPNALTAQALRDPVQNLICGVNIMAKLIARHGIIDGSNVSATGKSITPARGAAAYWSTLRPAYRVFHPRKQKWLNVGHKADIISHSRNYRLARK